MRFVFVSNYFNHHQRPFSNWMSQLLEGEYAFLCSGEMRSERRLLGYGGSPDPGYVVAKGDTQRARLLISRADVLVMGSVEPSLAGYCERAKGLKFRYSERPLKNGLEPMKYIPRLFRWVLRHLREGRPRLLCASAFSPLDYSRFGLFRNRRYKWGYYPELRRYERIDELIGEKDVGKIIWVARFLDWKHPEAPIEVVRRLKKEGYGFLLEMIGIGPEYDRIESMLDFYGLSDCVRLSGAMSPEDVRSHMEKCGIFLFTSGRQEGWGAVLNEAMNSGCAVVSSHLVGAAPYLIRHGENGYVYRSGDTDELYRRVKYLLDNPGEQRRVGEAAYKTIAETWNAEVAAERFVNLAQHILDGDEYPNLYEDGPCSRAEIIREDWYKGES